MLVYKKIFLIIYITIYFYLDLYTSTVPEKFFKVKFRNFTKISVNFKKHVKGPSLSGFYAKFVFNLRILKKKIL